MNIKGNVQSICLFQTSIAELVTISISISSPRKNRTNITNKYYGLTHMLVDKIPVFMV
jgi:hypothetical protein